MVKDNSKSFEITPTVIWRVVDDNTVVVSPENGDVVVLSETGSIIWQMLADKKAVSEIESYLASHYIVSVEQAEIDVHNFIEELIQSGLIHT